MQFLHNNEIAEWCRERGLAIDDDWKLLPDERLIHRVVMEYAVNGRTGRQGDVAGQCIAALGEWDESLLWVVDWGVWPSSEDWPTYYAERGTRGEKHSLQERPGHMFSRNESSTLHLFLTLVLENGWDVHVLPTLNAQSQRRLWCSHDGWVELLSATAGNFGEPAL